MSNHISEAEKTARTEVATAGLFAACVAFILFVGIGTAELADNKPLGTFSGFFLGITGATLVVATILSSYLWWSLSKLHADDDLCKNCRERKN